MLFGVWIYFLKDDKDCLAKAVPGIKKALQEQGFA